MLLNKRLCMQLFITFFKISPVTFGGGYAMIPLIEREILEKRGWMEEEELAEVFAVAESVPGAIAVNAATMIGYRIAGVTGAIASLLGVVFPTFLIVLILCLLFFRLRDETWIQGALEGIRAAVVALIAYAAIHMGKTAVIDRWTWIMMGLTVGVLLLFRIHPIIVLFCGAILGILWTKAKEWRRLIARLRSK